MTSQNPRIAIAVQKYYHPGQTFVNRHLRHLFDGNSCVITERQYRQEPNGTSKEVFYVGRAMKNAHDMLRLPVYAYRNNREHHCFRVPQGQTRAELVDYLKAQKADLILSEFGSQAMLVADIGKEMGLPVFSYFRGRDASYWINNKKRVAAYQKVFPELAGVFAVSQFLLDNLASVGLEHPNAHVVPSGTNVDDFKPGKKDPNLLLAVGRFVDKKYPQLTIRCFLEARKEFPHARLEMIGGGPVLKDCQRLIDEAGASEAVILHGQQLSDFVAHKLSQASIFVQHSVTDKTGEAEGLPSSIQEAMAAGCAILSTEHAGIPELVKNDETGYISPELDEARFIANMKSMLADQNAMEKMGQNARKLALERIDYRKLYAKVEAVMRASL